MGEGGVEGLNPSLAGTTSPIAGFEVGKSYLANVLILLLLEPLLR